MKTKQHISVRNPNLKIQNINKRKSVKPKKTFKAKITHQKPIFFLFYLIFMCF